MSSSALASFSHAMGYQLDRVYRVSQERRQKQLKSGCVSWWEGIAAPSNLELVILANLHSNKSDFLSFVAGVSFRTHKKLRQILYLKININSFLLT